MNKNEIKQHFKEYIENQICNSIEKRTCLNFCNVVDNLKDENKCNEIDLKLINEIINEIDSNIEINIVDRYFNDFTKKKYLILEICW